MVKIFSAKLIPLHTRGWEDRKGQKHFNLEMVQLKHCFNVSRALRGNLPLSFGHKTKLFLWFWITVKAFYLCPTLRTIKFRHADLTCQPLTLFREPDTHLGSRKATAQLFFISVVLAAWSGMFALIWLTLYMRHIYTPGHDHTEVTSKPCLKASFHISDTIAATSDFLSRRLSPFPTFYN